MPAFGNSQNLSQAFGTATNLTLAKGTTRLFPPLVEGSIAITSPVEYQTFQRNDSNQHSIAVTGTFSVSSGTLTGIQVRWNGGGWVNATLGSGTFTATLPNQNVGQGTLEARFRNNTAVTDSVQHVGVGDVYMIAGQSNAETQIASAQTYTIPGSGVRASMFKLGSWALLADPVKNNASPGLPGSIYPLLANSLQSIDSSIPIAFIPTAKGSTGLVNEAHWTKGGTEYNTAISIIQNSGVNSLRILWYQGERDSQNGVTQSAYQTALSQMLDDFQADLSMPNIKLVCMSLGDAASAVVATFGPIRLAHQNRWNNDADILWAAPNYDYNLITDPIHWTTNQEASDLTARWTRALHTHFYGGTQTRAPQYSSIAISPDGFTVTVTFTGGQGDLVAGASPSTGWTVTDANGARSISSISVNGAAKTVALTLDQAAAGSVVVRLGYGDAAGATIKDSGNPGYPLEVFEATVVSPIGSLLGRDSFTGTSGLAISARSSESGAWTRQSSGTASGSIILTPSGRARLARVNATTGQEFQNYYIANIPAAPHFVEAEIHYPTSVAGSHTVGIITCLATINDSFYGINYNSTTGTFSLVRKPASGSAVTFGSLVQPISAGSFATVRLEFTNSPRLIRGFVDGVFFAGTADTTLTITSRVIGLRIIANDGVGTSDTEGLHIDNFETGTLT